MLTRRLVLPLCCGLSLLTSRGVVAEDVAFLGVLLRPLSDELASHLGVKSGVVVEEVLPESPAHKAGLEKHDVVVAAGGDEVRAPDDLKRRIRAAKPGDELVLKLRRGAETRELKVALGKAPEEGPAERPAASEDAGKGDQDKEGASPDVARRPRKGFLGVGYGAVPEILAVHLNLPEGVGVVVGDVWKDSPAQQAGIATHDVLVALDGYEVKGPADFVRLLAEKKAEDKVKIELIHKGAKKTALVTLSERPKELHGDAWNELLPPGEDGEGWVPDDPRWQWPHRVRKGRVVIEGPKGQVYHFELPDEVWQAEDLARELGHKLNGLEQQIEKELGDLHRHFNPEELAARIKKLTQELDGFKGDSLPGKRAQGSTSSHTSVVRVVEDGYDITIKSQDGSKSVTVLKDGSPVVENHPFDKVSTLPEELRTRIEKVAGRLQDLPLKPVPKGASKIRA